MTSTLHTSIETITPEMAAEMLKGKASNRTPSAHHTDFLTEAILRDEWVLNGEPIILNGDGSLLDGQHRLLAVIKANKSITSLVVRGVSKSAFTTMDQGRRRSAADVLGIEGLANSRTLATAARNLELWRRRRPGSFWVSAQFHVTNAEILGIVRDHPHLVECVSSVTGLRKVQRLMPPGIAAWLYYEFSRRDVDGAAEFFRLLEHGENFGTGHPVFHLRERLLDNITNSSKLPKDILVALVIKAWNGYVAGREMKLIRWSDAERFPDIEPALPD